MKLNDKKCDLIRLLKRAPQFSKASFFKINSLSSKEEEKKPCYTLPSPYKCIKMYEKTKEGL